jgi:hypothetical protein
MDLFGPLKNEEGDKHYILCMTDAFTKYAELVALENKEAKTVADAVFDRWCYMHIKLYFPLLFHLSNSASPFLYYPNYFTPDLFITHNPSRS